MIDKVRPLKIENPAEGGTQTDYMPTETNPSQDYLSAAGIALQDNSTTTIDLDGSNNIQFTDATQTSPVTVTELKTAVHNTFDNSTNGFVATNVQAAIEEARSGGVVNIPQYLYTDPVSPATNSTWVLQTAVAGSPVGLLLAITNATDTYKLSYKTNSGRIVRTTLS